MTGVEVFLVMFTPKLAGFATGMVKLVDPLGGGVTGATDEC